VTQVNNGIIQLDEPKSCIGYDDTTITNLKIIFDDDQGYNNKNSYGVKRYGEQSFGYEIEIDDELFSAKEGEYNACLQVLRDNCCILDNCIPTAYQQNKRTSEYDDVFSHQNPEKKYK